MEFKFWLTLATIAITGTNADDVTAALPPTPCSQLFPDAGLAPCFDQPGCCCNQNFQLFDFMNLRYCVMPDFSCDEAVGPCSDSAMPNAFETCCKNTDVWMAQPMF